MTEVIASRSGRRSRSRTQQVTMKNGRAAIQGTCPDCGTKIFKIGKLEA
jgi:hypothetical protein